MEFESAYLKKFEKFKIFLEKQNDKSEAARAKINEIQNGILKRNERALPQIEENEKRNSRRCNGYATGCLALASAFALTCLFGKNLSEKAFAAIAGCFVAGEGVLLSAGIKYHIKLLINPTLKKAQSEIEKIKMEFEQFGDSESYLKAFLSVNNLDGKKMNDENNLKLLESPLSRWGKLVEIYPELENN